MLEPILIQGIQPGGQLTITTDVENYPGFADVIQGPWLMEQMQTQAEHVGTRIVTDHVTRWTSRSGRSGSICDSGDVYLADALIIATGAQARWLDLPSEQKFKGYGVSACATCDGFFYRGKEVSVIGGGNTAVEEALFLTNSRPRSRWCTGATPSAPRRSCRTGCSRIPKIEVIWDSVLEEVDRRRQSAQGERRACCATSRPARSPRRRRRRRVHRHRPHAGVRAVRRPGRDEAVGYIVTTAPDSTATSVPGVFAAGDVTDDIYRQAVTAAGQGCMAALEAEKFLAAHEHRTAAAAE